MTPLDGPVLVTGAGGFAGGHLVELLSQRGYSPTGWRRPGSTAPRGLPPLNWKGVDLLDAGAVTRAIATLRPTVIFHCAGAAHVGRSWSEARTTLEKNVLGTHHLLKALRAAGLKARVLIPGSAMVYQQADKAISEEDPLRPASPYALSKLAQEMLGQRSLQEDGQDVLLTRSFNHTGPRQEPSYAAPGFAQQVALIEAGRAEPVIDVGNLEASRDLTDVRDTVRAYFEIVEKGRPGVIYNVCSGQARKIRDVLNGLIACSRVRVAIRIDPSRYRPNDIPLSLGNRSRIEREVGWRPAIPFEQMLSDLLNYWRAAI